MIAVVGFLGWLAVILIRTIRFYREKWSNAHPAVVSCPWKLPYFGHALRFLPNQFFETFESFPMIYGDLLEVYVLSCRSLLITDASMAKEFMMMLNAKKFRRLRNTDHSSKVLGLTDGLFFSNGSTWSRMRRATAPSFSHQNTAEMFPDVAHEVKLWIQRLDSQSTNTIDMTTETMSLTLRVITVVAFGLGVGDAIVRYFTTNAVIEDVKNIFKFVVHHTSFGNLPEWVWTYSPLYKYESTAIVADKRFAAHSTAIVLHKRHLLSINPKPSSMIDNMIVKEQHGETLTDAEIVANVKIFYMAGSETTAVTLTWICYYLSQNPSVVEKLRAEVVQLFGAEVDCDKIDYAQVKQMPFANAVVKETLRLAPPIILITMELEDGIDCLVMSNGMKVNKGNLVFINITGIMLKEDVYPSPKTFKPDRWMPGAEGLQQAEDHWFPFGYGPRVCPGAELAMTEAALGAAMLAHTFDMALDCPVDEIKRVIDSTATSNKMPIKLTKRQL